MKKWMLIGAPIKVWNKNIRQIVLTTLIEKNILSKLITKTKCSNIVLILVYYLMMVWKSSVYFRINTLAYN